MDLHLGGLIIKILYLDFERGSQTLGSKDKIQEMFGYPMLTMNSWNQFQSMIGQLYTKEKTTNVIKIGTLDTRAVYYTSSTTSDTFGQITPSLSEGQGFFCRVEQRNIDKSSDA